MLLYHLKPNKCYVRELITKKKLPLLIFKSFSKSSKQKSNDSSTDLSQISKVTFRGKLNQAQSLCAVVILCTSMIRKNSLDYINQV